MTLKRRSRYGLVNVAAVLAIGLVAAAGVLLRLHVAVVAMAVVVLAVARSAALRSIACPSCGKPLGTAGLRGRWLRAAAYSWLPPAQCIRCGNPVDPA